MSRIASLLSAATLVACGHTSSLSSSAPSSMPPSSAPSTAPVVAPPAALASSASATPSSPAIIEPLAKPACTIALGNGSAEKGVLLRFEGIAFAVIDAYERAEIRLNGAQGTATFDVRGLHVTGEVKVGELELYVQKPALRDGWLDVKRLHPASAEEDAFIVTPTLPSIMTTPEPLAQVRFVCKELSLSEPYRAVDRSAKEIGFKEGGPWPLRATEDGPVVATITLPRADPNTTITPKLERQLEARLLTIKGQMANVRIAGPDAIAVGWIERSRLGETQSETTYEKARPGYSASMGNFRCPEAVPIFVRGEKGVTQVGVFDAHASIPLLDMNDDGSAPTAKDEARVDLGLEPAHSGVKWSGKKLVPFTRGASLRGCKQG